MKTKNYETYCQILKQELILAQGCTEPIAISYAAAILKSILKENPTKIDAKLSGNIIKNVKSVVVPGTDGKRGIDVAIIAGIVSGKPEKELEVLSEPLDQVALNTLLNTIDIQITPATSNHIFDIDLTAYTTEHIAKVRIVDFHTNVVLIQLDEDRILSKKIENKTVTSQVETDTLTIEEIVEFADIVNLEDVKDALERQIRVNMAIANEGIQNPYGANIGKVLLASDNTLKTKAKAYTAAGSDARMNGCEMPVCIVSGSGNQGMTASIPVIIYAKELHKTHEELLRALVVSDLVTIHQKSEIGRLSAYCGAISAGCGCGAGIAYLNGGKYEEVAHTLVNAVAILSGTICDGAKSSCAAKIAMAVEAGIFGYEMYQQGQEFKGGDGIITKGVENTIHNVGRLARDGMYDTDQEIMKIMTDKC